jgi:hypothetical protein
MNQSRLESIIEVFINYLFGIIIAHLTFKYLVPVFFDIHSTHAQAFGVTMLFTVISVIRSYVVRRAFNNGLHKLVHEFVSKLSVPRGTSKKGD